MFSSAERRNEYRREDSTNGFSTIGRKQANPQKMQQKDKTLRKTLVQQMPAPRALAWVSLGETQKQFQDTSTFP